MYHAPKGAALRRVGCENILIIQNVLFLATFCSYMYKDFTHRRKSVQSNLIIKIMNKILPMISMMWMTIKSMTIHVIPCRDVQSRQTVKISD